MTEIVGTISKLVERIDVSRRSVAALSLGGCIISGLALLYANPLTVTLSGTPWDLPLVGLIVSSWILVADVLYSVIGYSHRMIRQSLSAENGRISKIERTIVLDELDEIIRENSPLDSLLEEGFLSSLGRNGFRLDLSAEIQRANEELMQGITELVSRGGIILTRESPSSDIHALELAPDLFDYRLQWTWSAMRGRDGSELNRLRVTSLSSGDKLRKKLLSLLAI